MLVFKVLCKCDLFGEDTDETEECYEHAQYRIPTVIGECSNNRNSGEV